METHNRWASKRSVDSEEEPHHCAPTYQPSDIICPGSDTEETPEETKAKRQRYEDAAKSYMAGDRPKIISASLRGPLDAELGWVNPWRYRPRKPRNGDWWQPGSDNMLFTRENVMRRAVAHGLGSMTPREALAWCKASAQAELDSHLGVESQDSLMRSIEQDCPEERDIADEEMKEQPTDDVLEDEENEGDVEHTQRLSMANNYTNTPHTTEDGGASMRVTKRPVDAKWLKGSYMSKRARWDGPALPSPTPVGLNSNREQRRRPIPAPRAISSTLQRPVQPSGFGSIQRPRHVSMTQLGQPASTFGHLVHKMSAARSESRKPRQDQSTGFQHQQIDDLDEYYDELQAVHSSSFSCQPSQAKSRSSRRDLEDHSISDLEPDELTTTPYSRQATRNIISNCLSSAISPTFGSNKLPPLPRIGSSSQRIDAHYTEEDSFVTEVAPSSRDLEKFMFRKKRKASGKGRVQSSTRDRKRSNVDIPSGNTPLSAPVDVMHTISSPVSNFSGLENNIKQSHVKLKSQSATNNVSITSWDLLGNTNNITSFDGIDGRQPAPQSVVKKPLPLEQARQDPSMLQQRSSFLIHSSQITQPKDRRSFQRLPGNAEPILPTIQVPFESFTQTLATNTQAVPPVAGILAKLQAQKLPEIPFSNAKVAENVIASQDPNDISTQSYNTTPSCSRKSPIKPLISARKSPKVARLQRFSFETSFGGLLFSPMASSLAVSQATDAVLISKATDTVEHENHEATQIQTELGDYQAYMSGNLLSEMDSDHDAIESGAPTPQVDSGDVMTGRHEASRDVMDQIQKALSQNCSASSSEASARSPNSPRNIDCEQEGTSQSSTDVAVEAATANDTAAPPDQDQHPSAFPETIDNRPSGEAEEQSINDLPQPDEEALARANRETTPKPAEQFEAKIDSTTTTSESSDNKDNQEATPRQATQVLQSPFAQEIFIVNKPTLPFDSSDDPAPEIDKESETGWEGCEPQSPWGFESSDHLITRTILNPVGHARSQDPDLAFSAALKDIVPTYKAGNADGNERRIELPRTPDDENFGITPFRDLMSPSPSPMRRLPVSDAVPTNTQQLVDAAMQNPWTSSLKRPASIKAPKRVSFGHASMEDNEDLDGFEDFRALPGSPPPPDDDIFNEVIFGAGFTEATPFRNHFKVARKFSRILPESIRSPSKSSPPLSAQAEAFIAADFEGSLHQLQQPNDVESRTRHLKPRRDADENSHWQDWQDERSGLETTSPRSLQNKHQTFTTNMSNFDMDEALNQMGDFLEEWSVEAEMKKSKQPSSRREREDSGVRRRRLFGLI